MYGRRRWRGGYLCAFHALPKPEFRVRKDSRRTCANPTDYSFNVCEPLFFILYRSLFRAIAGNAEDPGINYLASWVSGVFSFTIIDCFESRGARDIIESCQ